MLQKPGLEEEVFLDSLIECMQAHPDEWDYHPRTSLCRECYVMHRRRGEDNIVVVVNGTITKPVFHLSRRGRRRLRQAIRRLKMLQMGMAFASVIRSKP